MKKFFLFIVCLLNFSFCFAAEQIERFDSVAQVKEDSSVLVTETITVRAAGDKIRRGIFRVLPYKGVSSYEVLFVLRNGKEEPYKVEKSSSGQTVYMGDTSVILSPGRYTYQLSYMVKGAVRFQRDFDEFYWNVTGNDWQFPIQSVTFRLILPAGAEIVPDGISFYTGFAGEKGRAAHMSRDLVVATTRPLNEGEGLTVSAAWNKGAVREPSLLQKILARKNILLACFLWLLLLAYYVFAWRRVGKDPAARVLRRFTPPEGLSPAQVRYVRYMGSDSQTLSVIIMSLVSKGCVQINKDEDGDFTLVKKEIPKDTALSAEEFVCLTRLFESQTELPVDNQFVDCFQGAISASCKELKVWAGSRFFSRNDIYNLPTLLFAFVLLNLWFKDTNGETVSIAKVILGMGVLMMSGVVMAIVNKSFPRIASIIALAGLAAPALLLLGVYWGILALAGIMAGGMFWMLVRAYTPLGRQKMDEIEGFFQYLQVAEKHRVFASNPTDAARIYCDYLPYAVALDVQNEWWNALEGELGEAAAAQVAQRQNVTISAADVAVFSLVLRSASVPKAQSSGSDSHRSSSGFGGGGSSGGGSGGGGGGGW